jgi:glucan phosphoethanolaminetransferase (alkaline phosphatase superfamily)
MRAESAESDMKQAGGRPGIGRFRFYIGAIVLVAAVLAYQHFMQSRQQVYGSSIDALTALQEKQLEAFLSMNQLLIALGTTMFGAMGFLLARNPRPHSAPRQLWPAAGSAICVGLSLYFGYKSYDDVLFMLQQSTFDLYGNLVLGDRVAHFATLMAGAFLFADFAFHEMSREGGHAPADDARSP